MYLDIGVKDSKSIAKLMKNRQADRGDGRTPFLQMDGPGVAHLLCEAAVSALNTPGLKDFGDKMWAKAVRLAPLSDCVRNNWQLIYGEPNNYEEKHRKWDKVWAMVTGGVNHEVGSHHVPAVRFQGDWSYLVVPPNRTL